MGAHPRCLQRFAANPYALPAMLLALGALYRIAWLFVFKTTSYAQGEMANVAIAFARTGAFADAYRQGQGPTAHVLPIPPLYAGLIYRAFGVQSPLSEAVLAASALVMALGAFVLLYRCFAAMGTNRTGCLLGLAIVCLVPLSFYEEVVAFKIWEGQLAMVLALGFLAGLLWFDRRQRIGFASILWMSLLAGLLFFVHPPLGLAAYVCAFLCLLDRLPLIRWPAVIGIAAAALALVLTPWTLRNMVVFHTFIPLRSDLGLELGLANHSAAALATDDLAAFQARLAQIHPFASDAAYDAMQRAGGEVPYARQLGAEAAAWIAVNPGLFAKLCARHFAEYFFPPEWAWRVYGDAGRAGAARLFLDRALHAIGLLGALFAVIRAPRRYRYAVIMIFVPALVYMITQPILRYRYLMFGLTAFFAADLIGRMLVAWPPTRRLLVRAGIERRDPSLAV